MASSCPELRDHAVDPKRGHCEEGKGALLIITSDNRQPRHVVSSPEPPSAEVSCSRSSSGTSPFPKLFCGTSGRYQSGFTKTRRNRRFHVETILRNSELTQDKQTSSLQDFPFPPHSMLLSPLIAHRNTDAQQRKTCPPMYVFTIRS